VFPFSTSSTHTRTQARAHTHIHLFGYIHGNNRKTNHHILYINRVSILRTCGGHVNDFFLSLSACSEAGKWAVMYMCAKVYILFLSTIFQLDVRTFPIVLYCILLLFVRHARSKGNKSNLFTHKSFCKILH
jgi:hypothetical protein